ncbi:MAG: methionine biosynthesis protein MetW [Verrucomicrobia bacterium]|nr:methionine biosynthesis protein MetW [Verrucomicrobiota bacterium]
MTDEYRKGNHIRPDLDIIAGLTSENAAVLDLGCGEGVLLEYLVNHKRIQARGVEISEANVRACIRRGLSVRHGNIEEGLADYPDDTFDVVILSQTLAYLDHPEIVLDEMLRVGQRGIVSFENAGHWRIRLRALRGGGFGAMICSGEPRARAITLDQFLEFVDMIGARVEKSLFLTKNKVTCCLPKLCAEVAVYVITKRRDKKAHPQHKIN